MKSNKVPIERLVKVLASATDITRELPKGEKEFNKNLHIHYNNYFRVNPDDEKPSIETFDNYLYVWALKIWPRALDIIREHCRR